MSQPDLTSANPPRSMLVKKPKSNIYTALLGVATMAMAFGCLMLYIEIWRHAPDETSFLNIFRAFGAVRGPL